MKTRLFRLLAWLAALYAAVLCVLYFQQENLLFHPAKLPARYAYAFRLPHEEIALPVNGAVLNGLHFRPPHAHSKGAILFFHGNAGALDSWGEVAQRFAELGYDSYVFDYRGYGKSSGQIRSQADLLADAERMAQYVQQRFPAGPIMVVGNSIGNGMAARCRATAIAQAGADFALFPPARFNPRKNAVCAAVSHQISAAHRRLPRRRAQHAGADFPRHARHADSRCARATAGANLGRTGAVSRIACGA